MGNYADWIYVNGAVITMDPEDRICQAVAVTGNKISQVGTTTEVKKSIGPRTEVIDLKGRSLLPGFIDAHCHAATYGVVQLQVPCGPKDVHSIKDIKQAVKERAISQPSGEWILGRGYNHLQLEERRHPTRWDLDEAAPNHRVFLMRTCGHMAVANSRVLTEFGITRDTPDPEGGRIERDEQGKPTGVLFEQAMMPIRMKTLPSISELEGGLGLMNKGFLSLGITSAQDASGLNPEEIRMFQKGVAEGSIQVRLYLMIRSSGPANQLGEVYLQSGLMTGFGNEKLRLGPYKLMLDGAGSGGTAAMKAPYPGDSTNLGLLYLSQEELETKIEKAHRTGYQIAVHVIGDRALEMVLAAFEKVLTEYPRPNHRHRLEHCGFPDALMMDKICDLGLIPVLGLPFLYELGETYLDIYGQDRLKGVYPLRSLLKRGIITPLSSDGPVISPNPLHGLYTALTRRTQSGQVIDASETVNIKQALRAYTLHGAYASFEEKIKGSLEAGKLADLIVLSTNILEISPEELLKVTVDLTMVDGRVVHQKKM